MPEEVLRRRAVSGLGNRVEDENEQQLETVSDKDLLVIFEYNMVVRHTPGGRVVLQRLLSLSAVHQDRD
jgi:hypothetical protein